MTVSHPLSAPAAGAFVLALAACGDSGTNGNGPRYDASLQDRPADGPLGGRDGAADGADMHETSPPPTCPDGGAMPLLVPGGMVPVRAPAVIPIDLNGDKVVDIVTPTGGQAVWVALGYGDGTFLAPLAITWGPCLGCAGPGIVNCIPCGYGSVTMGDFDRDGKLDLAASDDVSLLAILLGRGDGTFTPAGMYVPGGGPGVADMAHDLNADGYLDLAVMDNSSISSVTVRLGHGDGTFQQRTSYPAGTSPSDVAVVDLNGDGFPELAVPAQEGGGLSILVNNRDGTFLPAVHYPMAGTPYGYDIVSGDFNRDGQNDLAVSTTAGLGILPRKG